MTANNKAAWAVGLMTGTVLDGMVDIALLQTDGERIHEFGPWTLAAYPDEVNGAIATAVDDALEWRFIGPEPTSFAHAQKLLSCAQADAVADFLKENDFPINNVGVIGFHGQTVLHRAPTSARRGDTRQLADGQLMARRLGVPVVYDFRTADIRAGGQGAPLSAIYHRALLESLAPENKSPQTAVLNLGGVGNISCPDSEAGVIAFDTGPANGPLNDWIKRHGKGVMDRDGLIAKAGAVDEQRLERLLTHPYFTTPYPKSLDRYDFTAQMADGLSCEDGAATLSAFTAAAVGKALDLLPERPAELIICGGGGKNPHLVEQIGLRAGVKTRLASEVGWRGDAVEAECFAFLAMRTLRGLPISFPATTGVNAPLCGGRIARPA